ncbi:MAG: SHOCT-like domain-containing protein [Candidatus Xenobia bacterium]
MSQEAVLKILKMVQEGRITPEEAAELIAALPGQAATEKARAFTSVLGSAVSSAVAGAGQAVKSMVTGATTRTQKSIPARERAVRVRATGCSLVIAGHESDDVALDVQGMQPNLVDAEDHVRVELLGSKGSLRLPRHLPLTLDVNGCKLRLGDLDNPVTARGAGCHLVYDAPEDVVFSGDLDACNVEMTLPKKADPKIRVQGTLAHMDYPLHWDVQDDLDGLLRFPSKETESSITLTMTAGRFQLTLRDDTVEPPQPAPPDLDL